MVPANNNHTRKSWVKATQIGSGAGIFFVRQFGRKLVFAGLDAYEMKIVGAAAILQLSSQHRAFG